MKNDFGQYNIGEANLLYRSGKINESLEIYKIIALSESPLADQAKWNINRIKRNHKDVIHGPMTIGEMNTTPIDGSRDLAVICHLYHKDGFAYLKRRLSHLNAIADFFLTGPYSIQDPDIQEFVEQIRSYKYCQVSNLGRDVRPFTQIFSEIRGYNLCLKAHTKKGTLAMGELWKKNLYDNTFGTSSLCQTVINEFRQDPEVALIGSSNLFLHGKAHILSNQKYIDKILGRAFPDGFTTPNDWGFIAGTIFWFRPSYYQSVFDVNYEDIFEIEEGRLDGGPEHAFERLFGLLPYIQGKKIKLIDTDVKTNCVKIIDPDMRSKQILLSPSKILENINNKTASALGLKGSVDSINDGMLSGWIASIGDENPIQGYVKVDNNQDFEITSNEFRPDLAIEGIGKGNHAFRLRIPQDLFDGEAHTFSLYTKDHDLRVAEKKLTLKRHKRSFNDFASFLCSSYTQPELRRPLVEEDFRVLAAMEATADYFSKRKSEEIKFSIIMPVFNREDCISSAIKSVLKQLHENYELIVIDDGSTDKTCSVVESHDDHRIKLILSKTNAGVSAARNLGLKFASGDYICFLDSDNEWDSRHLSSLSGAIKANSHPDSLYTSQLLFVGDHNGLYGYRFGLPNINLLANSNFIDLNCFCHINHGTDSKAFRLFDTSLPRFVDWDYIFKLSLEGSLLPLPVPTSHYFLKRALNAITSNDGFLPFLEKVRSGNAKFLESFIDSKYGSTEIKKPISIIIPSFQASSDLASCLSSIYNLYRKQISSRLLEIIVVDNNSSHDEKTFINASIAASGATLIELDRNYGFTHAVNVGISKARPDSDIVLLNNDAELTRNSLEILQNHSSSDDVGLCVPAQLLRAHTPTINNHVPFANEASEVDVTLSAHHRNVSSPSCDLFSGCIEIDFAAFFCVYIPRTTLDKAGLLSATTGRHYRSDRVYCSVVKNILGLKILYCPFSRVYHGLQRSTDELKSTTSSGDYKRIFRLNTWSSSEAASLAIELPKWLEACDD